MFNISFGELLIIGVIGIIVIGPSRLPQTARFLGHFLGRIQRQVASVKADIKREIALEDMKSIHREYESTARDLRDTLNQSAQSAQSTVNDINATLRDNDDSGNNNDNGNDKK